jgi:hypothetical protein
MSAPIAPPSSGATQNIHSWESAQPCTNKAGPVLRAGLTEVLVTGMLIKWMRSTADREPEGDGRVQMTARHMPDGKCHTPLLIFGCPRGATKYQDPPDVTSRTQFSFIP